MRPLTKAQIELLRSLGERPHFVAPHYSPFISLLTRGLAEDREGRFSTVAHLTAAGRAELERINQEAAQSAE